MKLSKRLKIEGIILTILVIIGIVGMIFWYGSVSGSNFLLVFLRVYGSAGIIHIVVILLFVYWLWKVYKYQKN